MFFVAFFTLFWALLSYFTLVCAFLSQNQKYAHFQGWNYRKNYRKPINRHFSNNRQQYRYRLKTSSNYRWFEEIIGKVIDIEIAKKIIEKLLLSKKMTYRPPLLVTANSEAWWSWCWNLINIVGQHKKEHYLLFLQGLVAAKADWGSNGAKCEGALLHYQLNNVRAIYGNGHLVIWAN